MRPQTVSMVSLSRDIGHKETPYKFHSPKRLKWFSKLLWALLRKLNALEPFFERVETWTYNPIDAQDLHDRMLDVLDNIYRYGRAIPDEYVFIVGGKTFQELMGSPTFRNSQQFVTGPFGDGRSSMFGVQIQVLPNIEGIAVIPKDILSKNDQLH